MCSEHGRSIDRTALRCLCPPIRLQDFAENQRAFNSKASMKCNLYIYCKQIDINIIYNINKYKEICDERIYVSRCRSSTFSGARTLSCGIWKGNTLRTCGLPQIAIRPSSQTVSGAMEFSGQVGLVTRSGLSLEFSERRKGQGRLSS